MVTVSLTVHRHARSDVLHGQAQVLVGAGIDSHSGRDGVGLPDDGEDVADLDALRTAGIDEHEVVVPDDGQGLVDLGNDGQALQRHRIRHRVDRVHQALPRRSDRSPRRMSS